MIISGVEESNFAAAMTNRQFAALRHQLNKGDILTQLRSFGHMEKLKKAANFDDAEVRKWLTNGWNTEYLLRATAESLPPDQLVNAIQWAFPQAYYSVFTLTLAYFKAVGYTENSHPSVIRKFGALVASGKYPPALTFLASGGKPISFEGVRKTPTVSTLFFDPSDRRSIENQICQFLSGTRKRELIDRRRSMKFESKAGKKKKNLTAPEWGQVSAALGHTSLLSLLFRKRIKSNYQEIDTFLSPDLEAPRLFDDLIHVVSCMNLVHEAFIAKAIGVTVLESMLPLTTRAKLSFIEARLRHVREIVSH